MELYIGRSIDRRWRKELESIQDAPKIFTPYITSTTAESVLNRPHGEKSEIHIVFKAELFASGSSSLETVKRLAEQGHSLFHVKDLHAKIILVPDQFASIGS